MRYSRNPSVSFAETGGDIILTHPESRDMYYLDTVTSGLWYLLADTVTRDEIVTEFIEAFPETPAKNIERDIDEALNDFVAWDLVVAVD